MPSDWYQFGLPLDEQRQSAASCYLSLWQDVTRQWREGYGADRAWLTYSANYLCSTGGVKWALDPFSLSSRVPGVSQPDYAKDLQGLELVLLSHNHNDHLDLELLRALRDQPVTWVVPDFLQPLVAEEVSLPTERILTPPVGSSFNFKNLTITSFEALHIRGSHGVPELGYLVETRGKRWLFPGDTRNYECGRLPEFSQLDAVFAHLWLGKACALESKPPELGAFVRFFSGFKTGRLIVTHLYEFGRDANDLWSLEHFNLVKDALEKQEGLVVGSALMGECIDL